MSAIPATVTGFRSERERRDSRRTLAAFLVLATFFAAIFEFFCTYYHAGTYNLMWSVGLAAMITVAARGRGLASLGWGWGPWRMHALAYGLPLAYLSITYGLVWALGLAGVYDHGFVDGLRKTYGFVGWSDGAVLAYYLPTTAFFGLAGSLSSALGEEIGWRGFLVPELARWLRFPGVALVSGAIWAAWHVPLIVFGNYHNANTEFPLVAQLLCFFVVVLSDGVLAAYLRLKSGSLWPPAIHHAAHNLLLQVIFNRLTVMKAGSVRYVDELGLVLPLVMLPLALYFLARGRRELDPATENR